MRKTIALLLSASLLGSALFAKGPAPKTKKDFAKIKKEKIAKLTAKKETIEKRLSCIKKATSTKEIKACEKKYPLVKRNKKSAKAKKATKSKKSKK